MNSPFKTMTKEQEKAFFDADLDTNKHGKSEIEKDRKKIISNFKEIQDNIYSKFGSLWAVKNSFEKHTERRVNLKHIENKKDDIDKTLECLSNCDNYIFAQHNKSWDSVCYNSSNDWAVIFNENGKMMTSYKVKATKEGFLKKQERFKTK